MATEAAVLEALRGVIDPELHKDIVTLGMAKNVQVSDGKVSLLVTLTTPACPLRETIEKDVRAALAKVPGVHSVEVKFDAAVPEGRRLQDKAPIPGVKNLIAVERQGWRRQNDGSGESCHLAEKYGRAGGTARRGRVRAKRAGDAWDDRAAEDVG